MNIKGNSLDRFGDIRLQKAHLYKQCGLNQHCRQVDCDDCLEDEADKLGRNNDDQGVVMRFMLKQCLEEEGLEMVGGVADDVEQDGGHDGRQDDRQQAATKHHL